MRLRRVERVGAAEVFANTPQPSGKTPWREAGWCAVDLELTGLDPRRHEIIALGAVPIEEGRVLLGRSLYTLARATERPEHGAVLTHKLRLADLEDAPEVEDVIEQLLELLAGRVPIFHTAWVERSFLEPQFQSRGVKLPAAADTDVLGRAWLRSRSDKAPRGVRLGRLAELLGQRPEAAHHALGDALTTAQAFIALASHLDRERPQTVSSLLSASERPPGGGRFGFG